MQIQVGELKYYGYTKEQAQELINEIDEEAQGWSKDPDSSKSVGFSRYYCEGCGWRGELIDGELIEIKNEIKQERQI